MTNMLRTVVFGALVATILGCGGAPPPPTIDPVESKTKADEIGEGQRKAMEEQMKNKGKT